MVGNRVAAYSFSGNADDESGLENHGSVFGAQLASDAQGQPEMAYWFDGADDFILVPNQPALNFTRAISVAVCFRADELFNREMFLISHGSWENRWKISLTPDTRRIRWTLKTSHAIRDVDSKNSVQTGQFYHVVGCYDGTTLSLYINGQFSSSTPLTGPINTTSFDLTIGQILPTISDYNFKGLVDDVQIYNRQLDATEILKLFEQRTSVNRGTTSDKPSQFGLAPCYPNPFNSTAVFQYQLVSSGEVQLRILDVLGRTVNTLVQQHQQPGSYEVQWHGRNQQAQAVAGGIYFAELKQKNQVKCRKLLYLK
ncbi:T9SS type A sorting domain-containing protein, partial [bacterium]|nr:T9SS type A sorting domain-containing protein [bacterium]